MSKKPLKYKPDFLMIGAQKSGTSWLWYNLRKHKDIWLTPQKEIHYFSRSPRYPSPNTLSNKYFFNRILQKGYLVSLIRHLGNAVKRNDWQEFGWYIRYFFGTYNDRWYSALFKQAKGKIKGEITPVYSILDYEDVKHISELFPDIKIIFILRNPVERAWSQIRFGLMKRFNEQINTGIIKDFIDSPGQMLRGDYNRTLSIWKKCFPSEQIYIGFYDQLYEEPTEFLNDILNFLNIVDYENIEYSGVNDKRNVSKQVTIPSEIEYYLAEKYYPEIRKLTSEIGGYSKEWLSITESILNKRDF